MSRVDQIDNAFRVSERQVPAFRDDDWSLRNCDTARELSENDGRGIDRDHSVTSFCRGQRNLSCPLQWSITVLSVSGSKSHSRSVLL